MPAISNKARLELMPGGNIALEVGDLDAVLILTPQHARQLATRLRTILVGDDLGDLLAEHKRIEQGIAHKRRLRQRGAGERVEPV